MGGSSAIRLFSTFREVDRNYLPIRQDAIGVIWSRLPLDKRAIIVYTRGSCKRRGEPVFNAYGRTIKRRNSTMTKAEIIADLENFMNRLNEFDAEYTQKSKEIHDTDMKNWYEGKAAGYRASSHCLQNRLASYKKEG